MGMAEIRDAFEAYASGELAEYELRSALHGHGFCVAPTEADQRRAGSGRHLGYECGRSRYFRSASDRAASHSADTGSDSDARQHRGAFVADAFPDHSITWRT